MSRIQGINRPAQDAIRKLIAEEKASASKAGATPASPAKGPQVQPAYMVRPPPIQPAYMVTPPAFDSSDFQPILNQFIKDGRVDAREGRLIRELFNYAKETRLGTPDAIRYFLLDSLSSVKLDPTAREAIFGKGGPGYLQVTGPFRIAPPFPQGPFRISTPPPQGPFRISTPPPQGPFRIAPPLPAK